MPNWKSFAFLKINHDSFGYSNALAKWKGIPNYITGPFIQYDDLEEAYLHMTDKFGSMLLASTYWRGCTLHEWMCSRMGVHGNIRKYILPCGHDFFCIANANFSFPLIIWLTHLLFPDHTVHSYHSNHLSFPLMFSTSHLLHFYSNISQSLSFYFQTSHRVQLFPLTSS